MSSEPGTARLLFPNQELDAPFVFWNCSYFAACDTLRSDTPNQRETRGIPNLTDRPT